MARDMRLEGYMKYEPIYNSRLGGAKSVNNTVPTEVQCQRGARKRGAT